MMRAFLFLMMVMTLSTAARAQSIDPSAVQKDLATGDALKIMSWACVIEGAVIVSLCGVIVWLVRKSWDDKDKVHGETVAQLTSVVGLAQKQVESVAVLDRAIDVFTRR